MNKGILLSSFRFVLDAFVLYAVAFVFYFIRLDERVGDLNAVELFISQRDFLIITTVGVLVILLVRALMGAYNVVIKRSIFKEVGVAVVSVTIGMAINIAILFLFLKFNDFRFILMAFWISSILNLVLLRLITLFITRILLIKFGKGRKNVLLIGDLASIAQARSFLSEKESRNNFIVGELSTARVSNIESIHKIHKIDRIILAEEEYDRGEVIEAVNFCELNNIEFSYMPYFFDSLLSGLDVSVVNGFAILDLRFSKLFGWGLLLKRVCDIFISLIVLIFCIPVFVIIALAVKWNSGGSFFVKLPRISCNSVFNLYKFRSMVEGSESFKEYLMLYNERKEGPLFKIENDPRVTSVGAFLRKYHLDELLEFFNVLKGDMSIVGPRPHEPLEVSSYNSSHKKTLVVKPGITGIAQINGSHNINFEEEVWLNRYYIENWTLWLDFTIMIKTFWVIFNKSKGV